MTKKLSTQQKQAKVAFKVLDELEGQVNDSIFKLEGLREELDYDLEKLGRIIKE
jgi:hypothetical protein